MIISWNLRTKECGIALKRRKGFSENTKCRREKFLRKNQMQSRDFKSYRELLGILRVSIPETWDFGAKLT
jgi:hypothetical protein